MLDDTLAGGLSQPLNNHFDIGALKTQLNSFGGGTRLLLSFWQRVIARWCRDSVGCLRRRSVGRTWRTWLSGGRFRFGRWHCGVGVCGFGRGSGVRRGLFLRGGRGILRIQANRREPEQQRSKNAQREDGRKTAELPIRLRRCCHLGFSFCLGSRVSLPKPEKTDSSFCWPSRSEEHTSELQ